MTMKYRASEHSAQLKDLTDRVHFLGGEGKIWLDEQRMMLMQVSAMASFRRELIEMIGAERAKGFFLRLGYQSGLKDAQLARKLRPKPVTSICSLSDRNCTRSRAWSRCVRRRWTSISRPEPSMPTSSG